MATTDRGPGRCTGAWPLDPGLRFVVVVPARQLPTAAARAVLPATVPHADAAFNLGRMGLLIAGLADRTVLLPEAGEDRLHQESALGPVPRGGPHPGRARERPAP